LGPFYKEQKADEVGRVRAITLPKKPGRLNKPINVGNPIDGKVVIKDGGC